MARLRSRGARSLTRFPSMIMSPLVMSSRPTIIRSSVDFPHPEGPTRMMNSPSLTSIDTSLTAGNPSPYFLTMLCIWMTAMVQPFTAPEVRPETILRWNSKTMMMTGTVTMTDPAASWEYGGLNGSGPTKNDIWAGTVRDVVVDVSEIASTNSFHAKKNVRIAAVNTPGAASGTITFRNACHEVAPSTCAACSISHGISRKNADSVQMAKGRVNDR